MRQIFDSCSRCKKRIHAVRGVLMREKFYCLSCALHDAIVALGTGLGEQQAHNAKLAEDCEHVFINVGFTSRRLVCRYCDVEHAREANSTKASRCQ